MNLHDFLTKFPGHNQWLREPQIEVYVRKSRRLIGGKIMSLLDVANIKVDDKKRGHGVFTKWMDRAEEMAREMGIEGIYVESILEQRLCGFLEKRGYVRVMSGASINYFLQTSNPE